MTRETAAARAAQLLRELDENRQLDQDLKDMTRVSCCVDGCRSELVCVSRHAANLEATWRCLIHRNTPSTPTTTRKATP